MAERGAPRTQGVAGTWPPRDAARAAGIAPSGFAAWPSLVGRLREWIAAAAGAGGCLAWVPIPFGNGVGFFFTADYGTVFAGRGVASVRFCDRTGPLAGKAVVHVACGVAA